MTDMAERLTIVSAERVQAELSKLLLAREPAPGPGAAGRHRPGRVRAARAPQAAPGDRRAPPAQGRLRAHPHGAGAGDRPGGRRQPDLVLRLSALLHDIGKPKTRRFEPGGGVSFHHHEVVGAHLTAGAAAELKYSKEIVDDTARLVELHLRFHGYGEAEWTDSAVRRYVRDAGPAAGTAAQADPLGLHDPQPSQPGPDARARLRRSGEADRRCCASRRSSTPSGPTWTATEIMEILGDPAGPAGRHGLQAPAGAADGPRADAPRRGGRRAALVVGGAGGREPGVGQAGRDVRPRP